MRIERVYDAFRRVADERPETIALETSAGCVSYGELERRAAVLAAALTASGAVPGDLVGVLLEDTVETVASLLSVWRSGAVFVPLDPAAPDARLASQVARVSPSWLLSGGGQRERARALTGSSPTRLLDVGDCAAGGETAGTMSGEAPVAEPAGDDPCYVYFTSGSTGRPKGIVGRTKAVGHFIGWEIETFSLAPGSRVSQLTAVGFDAFLRDVFAPLCAGGTLCVPPGRETVLDARRLAAWIDRARVELIHCVPTLFRSLVSQELDSGRFQALRWVLLSGEPLLPVDVARWRRHFGDRIRLVNLYGPSETTMTKLVYFVRPEDADGRAIPIGQPMPGARAVVVDDQDRACPPGSVGEILIRTPYRSLGYFDEPELTAAAFVPNPFTGAPRDLVYRTGDFGRVREDGVFEFVGRRDSQVKIRGVRVELAEVENEIVGHPAVRDVVVVDRRDREDSAHLVAYFVGTDGAPTAEELRGFLAERLPEGVVPSVLVPVDALPRTLSGKVDRAALPDPRAMRSAEALVAPRTQVEEMLAGIWSRVLGVGQVGADDHFFALGGHSLLATRVLARLEEAFDVELPLAALFEAPVLASLAQKVEAALLEQRGVAVPALRRHEDRDRFPLSHAQQALWPAYELDRSSSAYNTPIAVRLDGTLDVDCLRRTLSEIVRRHAVLRSVFRWEGEAPVQQALEPSPVPLPLIDLAGLSDRAADREGERLLARVALVPFDLEQGPVFRAALCRLAPERHLALLSLHHMVSDLWSFDVFFGEVAAIYPAFRAGEPSPLPELEIQYADYAAWQQEWLRGPALEAHLEYWRERLAGLSPEPLVPHDRSRAPGTLSRRALASKSRLLPEELSRRFEELGRRQDATLFMTLLAALYAVLHRISGREDLAVGTDLTNRDRVETEGLIGFFINQLVLRVDLAGDPRFIHLLDRVRKLTLEALTHKEAPFDRVVELARPDRKDGAGELFQVKLTFQNQPALDGAGAEHGLPELELTSAGIRGRAAKLDLLIEARTVGERLALKLDYDQEVFDETTATSLLTQLERVIERVVEEPEGRLSALTSMLEEAERSDRTAGRSRRRKSRFERLKVAASRSTE